MALAMLGCAAVAGCSSQNNGRDVDRLASAMGISANLQAEFKKELPKRLLHGAALKRKQSGAELRAFRSIPRLPSSTVLTRFVSGVMASRPTSDRESLFALYAGHVLPPEQAQLATATSWSTKWVATLPSGTTLKRVRDLFLSVMPRRGWRVIYVAPIAIGVEFRFTHAAQDLCATMRFGLRREQGSMETVIQPSACN